MPATFLLMLGTDFPYKQFLPDGRKDRAESTFARRTSAAAASSISASSATSARRIEALLPKLTAKTERAASRRQRRALSRAPARGWTNCAKARRGANRSTRNIWPASISEAAADDAVFTADVGTPTIWSARYLKMNGRRRLIGSWVHGSMANAMAHAIGIQAAQPGRQVISLSGDGGFTMLMGDLITLTQMNLPVKVVVFNNGVLGFVALEMKAAGFVDVGVDLRNPDFAAMATGHGYSWRAGGRSGRPAGGRGGKFSRTRGRRCSTWSRQRRSYQCRQLSGWSR